MLLSLTVHEWAHAWSARRLGDDTAEQQGRLTLNPFVHADLVGTFLLPLFNIPFGWAKPVPVNPARFGRKVSMSGGMALTALAGPLSNLALALLCAVAIGLLFRFRPDVYFQPGVQRLLSYGLTLNVGLAIFNLLPIPPLDGSRVVDHFVPYRRRDSWESFRSFSPLLLLGVMAAGGMLLSRPIGLVQGLLAKLIQTIATA
ncbi:MAG: site-2 protease family protein [Archangiaceae bacterium]|nr:site-2 protease family protein [Archangiaceae bacterium]